MIIEHHRSAYRFAVPPVAGRAPAAAACPTAVMLTVRAAAEITARALGARPGRPQVSG